MTVWRTIAAVGLFASGIATAEPLPSGTSFLSDSLKAHQADEAANPGMLWVSEGAELWRTEAGAARKSCATCHKDVASDMRGAATRFPMVDQKSGRLLNLEGRINLCRTKHQNAKPFAYESDELLGLTAFVARQSYGMAMNVATDGAARPFLQRGKAFFNRRQGQLNLACKHCHVDNAGQRLRGDIISHGIGTGYPVYRLEWQSMGSLHRRLRSCSYGVRAIRFPFGAQEYLELELYLANRAQGVKIETPAIRP